MFILQGLMKSLIFFLPPNSVFSILAYHISVFLPFMLIFPLKNVCSTVGFFLVFHIGFRPQVVSARIDTLPIDIMLPEFAISPGSHLKTAQLSILGRLMSSILFWPTLTTRVAASTYLNCLERGKSVCKVTHRWSPALATPQERYLSRQKQSSFSWKQDLSPITATSLFYNTLRFNGPVPQFLPQFPNSGLPPRTHRINNTFILSYTFCFLNLSVWVKI